MTDEPTEPTEPGSDHGYQTRSYVDPRTRLALCSVRSSEGTPFGVVGFWWPEGQDIPDQEWTEEMYDTTIGILFHATELLGAPRADCGELPPATAQVVQFGYEHPWAVVIAIGEDPVGVSGLDREAVGVERVTSKEHKLMWSVGTLFQQEFGGTPEGFHLFARAPARGDA